MTERLFEHHRHHLDAAVAWDRAMALHRRRVPRLPGILLRRLRSRYGADLPLWDQRPPELYLLHNALGVVIHPETVFTGPAIVFHQVTFGNLWSGDEREGTPTIGEHVFIGAGAKILGNVSVGNFSAIGANMVVTRDVPPNTMVTTSGRRAIESNEVLRVFFAYGRVE